MKKLIKNILKIAAVVLVVLIIVIVVAFNLYANKALRWGVEKGGTSALKVPVTLGNANLSLLGGSLGLQNLTIDNPAGYANRRFLELKNASFKVNTSSLFGDIIEIPEIKIADVNVVVEQKGLSSNIKEILNNISSGEKAPTPAEKTQQASGKKLHINNLEITGVVAKVKLLPVPGKADTISLSLPPIRMKDLGNDGTMTTGVLIKKIIVAISQGIAEKGAGILPDDMLNPLKDSLKGFGQIGGALIEQGKTLGEGLKDAGKGLGDSLKGIIPKKE